MTQRSETLAAAFEQVAGSILSTVEGLSDAAWAATPEGERRTVGQIAYHTAEMYAGVGGFVQMAANAQPLPPLTMEAIHGFNDQQAARYVGAGRAGALELLRQNGAATAALLRGLSDAQLDATAESLGQTVTVHDMAQYTLIAHAHEHLASIQGATIPALA
jgi:hypothetical protein